MALGATTMIEQTGVLAKRLPAFLGMAVGSVAWFAAAQGNRLPTFRNRPRDPATFAMILLVNAVVFVSQYIPTPGASPINPITALRSH